MAGRTSTKAVRRLEKPRPLKLSFQESSNPKDQIVEGAANNPCDNIVLELESIVKLINNCNYDHNLASIIAKVCQELKSYGSQLEAQNIDQLDRYFKTLRDAAREDNIEPMCRLKLLEIIELRAMGWRASDNLVNYYRNRIFEAEATEHQHQHQQQQLVASSPTPSLVPSSSSAIAPNHGPMPLTQSASCSSLASSVGPSALAPGEVLKSSGKYPKPTKVAAKNYFKDEIIIRNSDSGKVAQGAKDRPVQITGAQEESIQKAKQLIEGTIRRNASPIRSNENTPDESGSSRGGALMHSLSMNDASIGEYQYTVNVGKDVLKLSGARLDLVRTARLVLEEYFAGDAERTVCDDENQEDCQFPEEALEAEEDLAVEDGKGDAAERKGPSWTVRNGHVGSGRIPLHRLSCEVQYSSDTDSSTSEDEDEDDENLPKVQSVLSAANVFGVQLVKTGFNGGRVPTRQPLRTSASLDSFHGSASFLVGSWNPSGPSQGTQPKAKTLFYTRDELLNLALAPRSHQNPFIGYTAASSELEAILKHGVNMIYFDPVVYRNNNVRNGNYRRGSAEIREKDGSEERL